MQQQSESSSARPPLQNPRVLLGLMIGGLVILLISGGALWTLTRPPAARSTPTPTTGLPTDFQITPPPSLEELATRYPELQSLLLDPSLDSVYKDFLLAYQTGGVAAARKLAQERGLINDRDEVRITLVIDSEDNTAAVAQELEKFGIIVEGTYRDLIDIAVPFEYIERFAETDNPAQLFEQLTQLKHIIKLRLPLPSRSGERDLGKVEGVDTTGAAQWHAAGFTGKGIKIGILDLGFDGYRNLLGKELPAADHVTVKSFVRNREPDASGEVHGTACAEIVHAMAPDAELYLAYYDGSEVGMGRAVEWLLEQGVQIISHSATGLVGPMDGTGSQAQLVDSVVNQGVIWVNAMGNYATEHYRGVFTDSDGDNRHEFPNGKEVMAYRPPRQDALIILNWDDWPISQQDYELYLYDSDSNLVASSQNSQNGQRGDNPFEAIRLYKPASRVYYIVIEASNATRAVTFDLYAPDGELEFPEPAYSLGTPADANRALSVGAIEWRSSGLEDFSSQGPTNDGRLKPELSAPDRVTTASYAPRSFPGTSASTPHVAGAAALVLSAFPDYTPQQVMDYLIANARDLGPTGPDAAFGYGSLQLPRPELGQTAPPQPTAVPPTPRVVNPAPVTPLPPAEPVTGSSAPLMLLVCLSAFMCLGALGLLGGMTLLILLSRPARRPPPAPVQYAPPVEQACLLDSEGRRILLRIGENTVGRSHENNIVLADDNQVSRHHAVIRWDGQNCTVTDLGSSNKTFVNGQPLVPHQPQPLHSGDRIRFGPDAKFVLRLPQSPIPNT